MLTCGDGGGGKLARWRLSRTVPHEQDSKSARSKFGAPGVPCARVAARSPSRTCCGWVDGMPAPAPEEVRVVHTATPADVGGRLWSQPQAAVPLACSQLIAPDCSFPAWRQPCGAWPSPAFTPQSALWQLRALHRTVRASCFIFPSGGGAYLPACGLPWTRPARGASADRWPPEGVVLRAATLRAQRCFWRV
jgi:hypothetical protein